MLGYKNMWAMPTCFINLSGEIVALETQHIGVGSKFEV